jgi:two-component system, OmpR family, response regulator VicR
MGVPRILYVEDDPDILRLVTFMLGRKGFEVVGAMTGKDGLEQMRHLQPDLVLLDLMLPDMDGWDVYQQMKDDPELAKLPIIIVTARQQSLDKVLGLHLAKVREYISKPFGPQELLEAVQRVFKKDTRIHVC